MNAFNRLPDNKNLRLVSAVNANRGYPVLNGIGDVIVDYLDCFENVINKYLGNNSRTLATRVDLHFPAGYVPIQNKNYMGEFFRKLQARIDADLNRKTREGKRVHPCKIGYVWVKEVGDTAFPHFHVLLLLNGNTYTSLGDYCTDSQHLYGMISRAWAAALGGEDMFYGKGIHVPDRPTYFLGDRSGGNWSSLMTRVSYLAKADTKYYWGGTRSIGYSA